MVLSLTYVFVPSSRGSTGVVDFLPKHGVSLFATGRTTSVVLSLAYVCIPAQQGIAWVHLVKHVAFERVTFIENGASVA